MDGLEPIHEAQERDRKDPFLQRIVGLEPNPDHHRTNDSPAKELTAGRSVRKRARARLRSAQNVENPPLEVAPTQTTVGSTAPLCSALRRLIRALNKQPKKAQRDFHAIRRKGEVKGQSRQPLMSWREKNGHFGTLTTHFLRETSTHIFMRVPAAAPQRFVRGTYLHLLTYCVQVY